MLHCTLRNMYRPCCRVYVLLCVAIAWRSSPVLSLRTGTVSRFYAIALKVQTDKVVDHQYQHLYVKYLQPLAERRLRLLESTMLYICLLYVQPYSIYSDCPYSRSRAWLRHGARSGPLVEGNLCRLRILTHRCSHLMLYSFRQRHCSTGIFCEAVHAWCYCLMRMTAVVERVPAEQRDILCRVR